MAKKVNPRWLDKQLSRLAAGGTVTCDTFGAKHILLKTEGSMLSRGWLMDVKLKNLGAGVKQLRLEERKYDQ